MEANLHKHILPIVARSRVEERFMTIQNCNERSRVRRNELDANNMVSLLRLVVIPFVF